jgi:hypothetical protein
MCLQKFSGQLSAKYFKQSSASEKPGSQSVIPVRCGNQFRPGNLADSLWFHQIYQKMRPGEFDTQLIFGKFGSQSVISMKFAGQSVTMVKLIDRLELASELNQIFSKLCHA